MMAGSHGMNDLQLQHLSAETVEKGSVDCVWALFHRSAELSVLAMRWSVTLPVIPTIELSHALQAP